MHTDDQKTEQPIMYIPNCSTTTAHYSQQQQQQQQQQVSSSHRKHPCEMFVGNLSFFCDESHLIDLFQTYGKVINVRIKRPDVNVDPRSRSLLYGFITMETIQACQRASDALSNTLFMGRQLK